VIVAMFDKDYFKDDEAARQHLAAIRWPNGPVCPHCSAVGESKELHGKKHRPGLYKCYACGKQFTVTVGTAFERSKIPLHTWFQAVYLLCSVKKGMSSHQMHRMLGVTYKTAWFMAHRIREAMRDGSSAPMGGEGQIIEVDETYWGNIPGVKRRAGGHHKEKIVSLVERDGTARSFHVQRVNAETPRPILYGHIALGSRLMTDRAGWYRGLGLG
jgi:transposase-like protein